MFHPCEQQVCISHWTPSLLYKFLYYQVLSSPRDEVQEAALSHLEDEAHLGARGDLLEEAFLCMGVSANEVARGRGQEGGQEHQQLSERHRGGAGAEARTGTAASGSAVVAATTAAFSAAAPQRCFLRPT